MQGFNFMSLLTKIFGFVGILIVLGLGPSVQTANSAITSGNITNLIAMDAIVPFGAPILIIALLVGSGLLAFWGTKGATSGLGMASILGTVFAVVVALFALKIDPTINDKFNAMIDAAGGVAGGDIGVIVYQILPLVVYLIILAGCIAPTGISVYKTYKARKGKKSAAAVAGANF